MTTDNLRKNIITVLTESKAQWLALTNIVTLVADTRVETSLTLLELEKEGLVEAQGNGKGKPRSYALKSRVIKTTTVASTLATPPSVAGAIISIPEHERSVLSNYEKTLRDRAALCEATRR